MADPDAAPRSCAELEGLAPEASVAPQDLPKLYGTVSNDVTGLFSETVDCYVWADGVTGLVDKCQWMGRTDGPWDAYIANNGVTVRCPGIANGGTFVLDGVEYTKRDRAGLDEVVANSGRWSELPTSCTTGVDDMSRLFEGRATINENLSSWDTGEVEDMSDMFNGATAFNNGDPGNNGANPLDAWDTSKVEDMSDMFRRAYDFNQDVSDWDTSAVEDMASMFRGAFAFNNGDPGNNGANPLDAWDTSKVEDMSDMFRSASAFNQDVSDWDTGAVTNMASMFYFATAFNNGDPGNNGANPLDWADTSKVEDMSYMFFGAVAFNQYIGGWNTGAVTTMGGMFRDAEAFNNGDPGNTGANPLDWADTSKVEAMSGMFFRAVAFNQDVSDWNTGAVTNMIYMFRDAEAFNNGDPGNNGANPLDWADTSKVEVATAFNQDLQTWVVPGGMSCTNFATGATAWLGQYDGSIATKTPPLSASMIAANCGP